MQSHATFSNKDLAIVALFIVVGSTLATFFWMDYFSMGWQATMEQWSTRGPVIIGVTALFAAAWTGWRFLKAYERAANDVMTAIEDMNDPRKAPF